MQYTLMFYMSPSEFAARTDPGQRAAFWGAFLPYVRSAKEAGILVGGTGLERPEAATTIRHRDGKKLVIDGPFAETKEQLGGFLLIEVPDSRHGAGVGKSLPGGAERNRRGAA